MACAPRRDGIAAVEATGHRAKLLLHVVELPERDGQQAIGAERDAFLVTELLLEVVATEAERRLRARREIRLQIVHIALDRGGRFGRRVREVAEDVEVVERRERARQIRFDELERAPPRLEANLHEDAGALLDVVARGLDQPRHLAQLRHDAPGALGFGRVGKQRLAGEARADRVGVDLRVSLPAADGLEVEHPRLDVGADDRMFDPLGRGEMTRRRSGGAGG